MRNKAGLKVAAVGVLMLLASTSPALATIASDAASAEGAFREDTTPPFCRIDGSIASVHVVHIRHVFLVIGDAQSGLARVRVLDNNLVALEIREPEASRSNLGIDVTSIRPSGRTSVLLEMIDRAGNSATCEVIFGDIRPRDV